MAIRWEGTGVEERGFWANPEDSGLRNGPNGPIVAIDPRYFRPAEVDTLLGDPSKAREKLGWVPRTSFDELVAEMAREDLQSAQRDALVREHGYTTPDHHE